MKKWLLGQAVMLLVAMLLGAVGGESATSVKANIYTFLFVVGVPVTLVWLTIAALSSAAKAVDQAGQKILGSSWQRFWSAVGSVLGALLAGAAAAGQNQTTVSSKPLDDGGAQETLRRYQYEESTRRAMEAAIRNTKNRA